MIGNIAKRQY